MKKLFWIFSISLLTLHSPAQSNAPVQLALISETDEASAASDILTAQLSGNQKIHLLERDEIEKVYREQGLSAGNRDDLKLGRILGADGLLFFDILRTKQATYLIARLVAVKPGVILTDGNFSWPLTDTSQWTESVATYLDSFLPKLTVLAKDAIPVSVVNIRSAVQSVDEQETGRQLKLLTIHRLSQEPQIFVLERQQMQLLVEEKELKTDESAFWNGSYLLDGVMDENGYSNDTITINARLTPPKGTPLPFEVSGSRTNFAEVVNHLTAKVIELLKVNSTSTNSIAREWTASDESSQYFDEANWAFKWGMFQEAKSAGEAAWALGKQSREVAEFRIKAYQACAGDPGFCVIDNEQKRVDFGQQFTPRTVDFGQLPYYISAPAPEQFKDMIQAEELFQNTFRSCATLDGKLDPAWLDLGETLLSQASLWLRYYYFTVEARPSQEAAIERAKELCLAIDGTIENHPGFANADINHTLLAVKTGNLAFWMDTPEQCLTFYRAIIESGQWPVVRRRFFNEAYFEVSAQSYHGGTTASDGMGRSYYTVSPVPTYAVLEVPSANLANPCLTGWTWADRKRCSAVWNGFIDELCNSPKPLTSLEGRLLRCSYSWSEKDFEQNITQLLDFARQQHDAIIAAGLGRQLLDDLHELLNERALSLALERRSRMEDQFGAAFELRAVGGGRLQSPSRGQIGAAFEQEFTAWLNTWRNQNANLQENQRQQNELQKKRITSTHRPILISRRSFKTCSTKIISWRKPVNCCL